MPDLEYSIIGGGVIGRSIAQALTARGETKLAIIEKCRRDALENQSTRNSGVIHAGTYYQRSTRPLKARLCVEGNAMLYEFCRNHDVSHARCGKLIVATNAIEEGYLDAVMQTCRDNQVQDVEMVDGKRARALEPNVATKRAIYAPSSGIIDAVGFLHALRRLSDCHELYDTEVVAIRKERDAFVLTTESPLGTESFSSKTVINAAGLYADVVARLINPKSPYQILPVRGEAAKFYRTRRPELAMSGMNVYPVPHGFYKTSAQRALVPYDEFERLLAAGEIVDTVGVHLTPTLDDKGAISKVVTVCPIVTAGRGKEDYGQGLRTPAEYLERVSGFFPSLRESDLELHQAGIQARLTSGLDWVIEPDANEPRFLNLIGIDSPGLTGSLAIAKYVLDQFLYRM